MLHAFDAATGDERFAFIPHGVWSNLVNLVNPYYNEQHHYYVDGSPQANDVKFSDNSWHTVVVTNEGAGGSTIFALDVTNPASLTTEAALSAATLWEFSDVDMGLSFSVPSIVNTNAGQLTFFGNGYDSPSSKPVLYAVSTQTGSLVSKIDLCAAVASVCNSSLANGLSSVTVVNTSGQLSQAQNMVYAGDLQGNLWRIDISGSSASSWTVSVLFQARDPNGNPQPITTPPAASLNPRFPSLLGTMVFVGTGELLSATDLTNSQIQSIYGVYDPPAGYGSPMERGSLVAQTLTSGSVASYSGGSEAVRYVSNNPVSLPTQSGWYVDLNILDGERSITAPVIEAGGDLAMTTYYPNTSFCTGGGESWLMVLNYANGGSFASPQLDTYGNGTISSLDTGAGGLNPAAMSLGAVYATAPVALSAGSGRFLVISESSDTAATANSPPTEASIAEAGPGRERISWWEVR
jgi:type IV pilus assembly protein PilY1